MKKLVFVLKKTEEWLLLLGVTIMGSVLFLQIVMRFVFSSPLQWPEELARYLHVWITFIGIGYGIRKGSHIGMTLIKDRLKPLPSKILSIFFDLLNIFAFVVLLISSLNFVEHQNVLSTAMQIPMQLVYGVIPVFTFVCILYSIASIVTTIIDISRKEGSKC